MDGQKRNTEITNDTRVYIVDKEYQVLYANDLLKADYEGLNEGCYCYEVINKRKQPCERCPIRSANIGGDIYYNEPNKKWVNAWAAKIDVPEKGECHLIMVNEMRRDNKKLFYSMSNTDDFDDLVEIDLEEGTSRILYYSQGKYATLGQEGNIKELVLESIEMLIHPEDRVRYIQFWNESDMLERIVMSPSKMVMEEFRHKKVDGGWGWIRQSLILSSTSGNKHIFCFVKDIEEEKAKEEALLRENEQIARIDKLTGLYRASAFFQEVDAFVEKGAAKGYCMIALDVEHFKLFNEWYGWKKGDAYLMDIALRLKMAAEKLGGWSGYMRGDNFALFMKYDSEYIAYLQSSIQEYVDMIGNLAGFTPGMGVFLVEDEALSASIMYDRAVLALNQIRGNYSKRVSIYNVTMIEELGRELELISDVQRGIEQREFTVYMQPQVHVPTGKIVGAESLVRWKSKEKGLISPGYFIPILEKNGFIANLDKYIWEEVCAWQKRRMDKERKILPVSVNVSRVDIYSMDVVECFVSLTEKYDIPRHSIKIEITESAYAEDDGKIGKVADALRLAGFSVYLDDFGSGYSSLNMLKNIYVDALKMDLKFLDMDETNVKKGESILESVINMARILRIPIIVEGVEDERQLKYLTGMGCRYVQGYFYYRPMPMEDFERLLESSEVDYDGFRFKKVEQVHIREFMDENLFSDTMINNIIGAVAFYDMHDGNVELTRVNEQFYQVMRIEAVEFDEYKAHIKREEYEEHQKMFRNILEGAYENPVTGMEGNYVCKTPAGELIYLHIRAFFLRETSDGHRIFYVGFLDTGGRREGAR